MRLNKKGENKHSVGKVVMKSVMKFLLANPPLLGIIVVVIIGFIAYTLYSIDYQLTQIMKQYQSLSARRDDSKEGFDKKLFYITVDDNGNTTITVGFSSEEQQAQAEKDLEDSGNDGGDDGGGDKGWDINSTNVQQIADAIGKADPSLREAGRIVAACVLTNTNDPALAAAFLGNSNHEGTFGQWQNASFSIKLSKGSYNDNYKGKTADKMNTTGAELYADLKAVSASNGSSKTAIGFGPTQATSSGNIDTYVQIMETLKASTSSNKVTIGLLQAMEVAYCNIKFNSSIKNTGSAYMKGMKYGVDDVYNGDSRFATYAQKLGDSTVREIIQDTICVIANYERYSNYKTDVSKGIERSLSACQGFAAMKDAGVISSK